MSLNPGDRVEWINYDSKADPMELHGVIEEVVFVYRVKWDDGTEEEIDSDDIKVEGT